jgi:HEAT repeat protein
LRDDLFHTNLMLAGHCLAAADPTVRHHALSQEVVTRLFQVLQTTRYALTQAQVAETLAGIGETTVTVQLAQLSSDEQLDSRVRQRIAAALGQSGERAIVLQLAYLLSDRRLDSGVRQSIAEALGQLGERSIAPHLLQLLSDEQLDSRVRERIAGALGRIGEPSIVPQLAQLLSDERLNLSLRQRIAEVLSTLATDEATLQVLTALFPTSDIADSMYHLLWTMSRQMGVRIFSADRPNGTGDHIAFSIEPI